jgi:hypothetical protein
VALTPSFLKTVSVALFEQLSQLFLRLFWNGVDLEDCTELLIVRHGRSVH